MWALGIHPEDEDACGKLCATFLVGESRRFVTSAWDERWEAIEGVEVDWTVDDPSIARIEDGVVTGLADGETVVRASAGEVEAELTIVVGYEEPDRIFVLWNSMHGAAVMLVGDSAEARAEAIEAGFVHQRPVRAEISFAIADPSIAVIEEAFVRHLTPHVRIRALRPGTTTLTATGPRGSDGPVDEREVTVVSATVAPPAYHVDTLRAGTGLLCSVAGDRAACWGENHVGQVGDGSDDPWVAWPSLVAGDHAFRAIAPGQRHACALDAQGKAWCWGGAAGGLLGAGSAPSSRIPIATVGDEGFDRIWAGEWHTCALTPSGLAHCWGENGAGQLGPGAGDERTVDVPTLAWDRPLTQLALGTSFTCGLDGEGKAWCWGNPGPHLGRGDGDSADDGPREVVGGHRFQQIAAGPAHVCGLDHQGKAWCWGEGSEGRLGVEVSEEFLNPVPTPVPVAGNHTFASIACGGSHTCALTTDGIAWCWGRNDFGQLGTADLEGGFAPRQVHGDLRFDLIVAGSDSTCARTREERGLYCWGDSSVGQLGIGATNTYRHLPVPVQSKEAEDEN